MLQVVALKVRGAESFCAPRHRCATAFIAARFILSREHAPYAPGKVKGVCDKICPGQHGPVELVHTEPVMATLNQQHCLAPLRALAYRFLQLLVLHRRFLVGGDMFCMRDADARWRARPSQTHETTLKH